MRTGRGDSRTSDRRGKNRVYCCHDNPVTRSAQRLHTSMEPNVCVSNFNWLLNGRVALARLAWTCAFGFVAACDIRFRGVKSGVYMPSRSHPSISHNPHVNHSQTPTYSYSSRLHVRLSNLLVTLPRLYPSLYRQI